MKSQLAQTIRGPIEYTFRGKGPVILIIHGTSSNCFEEAGTGFLLEQGFSLLIPSRPGYGRTPSTVGESAEGAADSMVALLDALQIQTVHLIAISGGGPTGIHLAAKYPERIRSLILESAISNTDARSSEEAYTSQKQFYQFHHKLIWSMLRLMSNLAPKRMARQTMVIFSKHDIQDIMKTITPKDIAAIRKFYQKESSAVGALLDLEHIVTPDTIRAIQRPSLIIHSREDNSVPFQHALFSKDNIKNSDLFTANTWGHFLWIGKGSAEVSAKVIEFFKS